jgi:hypothetical protein
VVKFFVKWEGGMRMLGRGESDCKRDYYIEIILGYGCVFSPS